jgi:cysteine desulfurase
MIYLDNNATTRPLPEVVDCMARHWRESFANPGSRHAAGRRARQVLESARDSIAAILGAHPDEVIFTSGGTESNNMAILGLTAGTSGTIALTAGEHPAVMEACRFLETKGWRLSILPMDEDGLVNVPLPPFTRGGKGGSGEVVSVEAIANQTTARERQGEPHRRGGPGDEATRPPRPPLMKGGKTSNVEDDGVRLITLILAHNETGVIQDVRPIAAECMARGIPFHVDAVQAVGKIPVNFHDLGVTSLALGAHKFYGPRGIGALLLKRGAKLAPSAFGGHQESGRRPGTEVVPLIAGMAKALEMFHAEQEHRLTHTRKLRDLLEQRLASLCAPVVLNGSRERRLPNTLNLAFPGVDGEALLVALDLEGIACSLGSTCASGSAEPAPVLLAMNRPKEVWHSSVRFSVGIENTQEEIELAAATIAAVVNRLRSSP